jgi:CheY-like chemotaxis protein
MSPSPNSAGKTQATTKRVLVVQNEPTLRLGFSYALCDPRFAVETAANGLEALEKLSNSHFDIVILDLSMPGLDGVGVVETLRSRHDRVPVVLCTTQHRPYASMRALGLGVVDFLLKPTLPADIRRVVDFVLTPPLSPLARALAATRNGRPLLAIQLLEKHPRPQAKDRYWLRALKLIRDASTGGDTARLEEELRFLFPKLAFNPPPLP